MMEMGGQGGAGPPNLLGGTHYADLSIELHW